MKLFRPRFNQPEETLQSELKPNPVRRYPSCDCLAPQFKSLEWQELKLHREKQDTQSEGWKSLGEYIQKLATDGGEELNPRNGIGSENWEQIVELPSSIAKLQSVKVLSLYGSHLVRIPPAIGEMANLEEFDAYTSYRLHWLPYEITRCKKLKRSRVSTRALYGNYKYRPPFPRLPDVSADTTPAFCSVCRGPFKEEGLHQVWLSLLVAKDTLPLLVHACSNECIRALPKPGEKYVAEPHQGGLQIQQPPAAYLP